MPGKFVFPGGRAEAADAAIPAASELGGADVGKLLAGMGSRPSTRRARALGLCAIRETFEETGLRVAKPSSRNIILPDNQDWLAFLKEDCLPALGDLRYFARAVTPPGNVRRYDTRFFIAFRDSLPEAANLTLTPSGELEDLDWVGMDDAGKLDTARITQAILGEAQALLTETGHDLPATLPVVQYSKRHGRFVREVI